MFLLQIVSKVQKTKAVDAKYHQFGINNMLSSSKMAPDSDIINLT